MTYDVASTCAAPGCASDSSVQVVAAEKGTCVNEQFLCEEHARDLIAYYARPDRRTGGARLTSQRAAHFEIQLVATFRDYPSANTVYLREIAGTRLFAFFAGYAEAAALAWYLKHTPMARPLTHEAMAQAIDVLGGQLRDVIIHRFDQKEKVFYAELRIQQGSRTVSVDVRPSDALNLAVVSAVPILISEDVLAKVAEMEQG